jgi:hypothetical protein
LVRPHHLHRRNRSASSRMTGVDAYCSKAALKRRTPNYRRNELIA